MTQQGVKFYVVPATDEKGQVQYFLVEFNSSGPAKERVQNVVKTRPGWKVTGDAIEAIRL
jgi:hypothetical protein